MRAPEEPNAEQTGENRTVIWHGVRYVLRSQIMQGLARLLRWEKCSYYVLGYPTVIFILSKTRYGLPGTVLQ